MTDRLHFHNLVLGSGEAGKYIAWTLAKSGQPTAVIERGLIGGSCPNIACLPSKNVIHSAKAAWLARRLADFGLDAGPVAVRMAGVRGRKRQMVDGLVQTHLDRYKESGAQLIMGEGRFTGPATIEVRAKDGSARLLTGDRVFLNVGTSPAIPDVPGLAEARALTHIEALELDRVPKHLLVLGGGYVGLEFAQAMRRFGSRVTMIVRGAQLAAREDPDAGQALSSLFREEGIDVLLETSLRRVDGLSGKAVRLRVESGGTERVIEGTDLLVATGRVPNTRGIGLEKAGVHLDGKGYVRVNERLETTAPMVWAMGECAGSPQLTHVAFDDFRIVRDNLQGGQRSTRERLIPFCLFTDPPLARVGLNEKEAGRLGLRYRLAAKPMAAVLRTRTLSETRGFMKVLIAEDRDQILGATLFGAEAGELIAVVQTAMLAGLPYTALRDALFTHPTMAEGLNVLFADAPVPVERADAGKTLA